MDICKDRGHGTIGEFVENMRQVPGFRGKVSAWWRMFLQRLRRRDGCCGVPGAPGC